MVNLAGMGGQDGPEFTYNIDKNKIGVLGFSAGAHLAALVGVHYKTSYIQNDNGESLKPDFMILLYPIISMDSGLTHMGSRWNLLGRNPRSDKVDFFCVEKNVTNATPPTYLIHASFDNIVPVKNSVKMYKALQSKGVYTELHLFPSKDP